MDVKRETLPYFVYQNRTLSTTISFPFWKTENIDEKGENFLEAKNEILAIFRTRGRVVRKFSILVASLIFE